jgi:hypothetical protein
MARAAMPKAKPKKATKVQQPRVRKSLLQDPSWEGCEKWSGQRFSNAKHSASWYYNQNYATNDLIEFVFEWMQTQEQYTRNDIRAARLAKANTVGPAAGIYARMLSMGMPDEHTAYSKYWMSLDGTSDEPPKPVSAFINKKIKLAIAEGETLQEAVKEKDTQAVDVNAPSIQERMRDTCSSMVEELEEFLDSLMLNEDPEAAAAFNPLSVLRTKQAKPGHARIIRNWYIGERDEFTELLNPPTAAKLKKMSDREQDMVAQLKEGYNHLDAKQRKMWLSVYQRITDACDIIEKESKIVRAPRKVKAKSPADLVKALKFKNSDSDYGIASVPPTSLVGANIALVFNTKTRKIGVYYASNVDPKGMARAGSGLSVKGTSLVGFDTERSVQRTVRKPAELLPQIKKTTRAKTEKLFEAIATTETKLNGRFNEDVVILAVF